MNLPAPTVSCLEEAQRRFLLQVMGIQFYVPRNAVQPDEVREPVSHPALPAHATQAAPTQPLELPEQPSPAAATAPDGRGAAAALEMLQADAADLSPVSSPARLVDPTHAGHAGAPAAVTRQAPAPVSASRSLSFQLLLLQTDRKLAVCAGIPSRPRAVLERPEQQLLRNILHWLGCAVVPDAAARQFSWPLPGGIGADDAAVAGRTLQGFLAQAQQELGFSRLLILGGDLLDALETGLVDTTAGWQGWYGPSLAGMLEQPALKRELWLRLQSLHAGLQG